MIYETPSSPATLLMRRDSLESHVFYENIPNQEPYVKKYYPPTPLQSDYAIAPKVSASILAGYVNRINSLVYDKLVIDCGNETLNTFIKDVIDDNGGSELYTNIITNMLVGGNYMITISNNDNYIKYTDWSAEFIGYTAPQDYYVEYLTKDGVAIPVTNPKITIDKKTMPVLYPVNSMEIGGQPHTLGFTPAIFVKNIDKYNDRVYGKPYVFRFLKALLEYNLTLSQMARAIRIFQNVWITNKEVDDLNKPLRIQPDVINFLGEKGTLEQAQRNLVLNEEREYCSILRQEIAQSSQIPTFLAGMDNVTKLESGIALQIALQPLEELMGKVREVFIRNVTELVNKTLKIQFNTQQDFPVQVMLTKPQLDANEKIALIQALKADGTLTAEEARALILPYMGL